MLMRVGSQFIRSRLNGINDIEEIIIIIVTWYNGLTGLPESRKPIKSTRLSIIGLEYFDIWVLCVPQKK